MNEYDSDPCLEYLKKIDSSFNEDKSNRIELSKTLIKYNYPGNITKTIFSITF